MGGASPARKATRLSRDEFLARALGVLSEEGEGKLRIDRLVESLGVTKGSFYWHFENRADFVARLARHWAVASTEIVISSLESAEEDPMVRLRTILNTVFGQNLTRWDLSMRAWATYEAEVEKIVREVDRARLETIRGLLGQLGFKGPDLEARTRLYVTYASLEIAILDCESQRKRLGRVERILEIITAGSGSTQTARHFETTTP